LGDRVLPTLPMEAVPMRRGDVFRHVMAGGGGYGDPLDRDPALVLEDVLEGWISPERALDPYGVVLSGDPRRWETLAIDAEATAAERARRRSEPDRAEGHRRAQERL